MQNLDKLLICIGIYVVLVQNTNAQDIPQSQQFSNLVVINPAFAGTTLGQRTNYFYRNQWLNVKSGLHDFGFAYDFYLKKVSSGLGVVLKNEILGSYIAPSLDVSYAYIIRFRKNFYLSMGLQAGLTQRYLLTHDLVFEQSEIASLKSYYLYPDFATGIIGLLKNGYFGLSIDHLNRSYMGRTKYTQTRQSKKYTIFAGYIFQLNTRLISDERYISPNIMYQFEGGQHNITWGSSFQYQSMVGGLWLRNNLQIIPESLIISAGYKTKTMRLTYSYDININKKTTKLVGAHEISFTNVFGSFKNKKYKGSHSLYFLR